MPSTTPSNSSESLANVREAPPGPSTAAKILGTDPWMRFDLWANRAWEAAERASEMANSAGAPISSEFSLDPRVAALFHLTEVAKDFSEMVNPMIALGVYQDETESNTQDNEMEIIMSFGDETEGPD